MSKPTTQWATTANTAPKPDRKTHAHRAPPKPLRKNGLHTVAESSPASSLQSPYTTCKPHPMDWVRAEQARLRNWATGHPQPIRNSTMRGDPYTCPELARNPRDGGPSSQLPSRVHERLHYPDGRVTDLAGAPISPSKV